MDKEELIKLVEDPKYIPGIYNYCDRWCERCQFTSRCLNHSIEEEQNYQLEEIDEANERFWHSIENSFKLTFSLIEDLAKEEGIDLESIEIAEDAWSELLKYFEDEKKGILKIINYLKQIREIAEKEFPNARSFIRPGFDEVGC
jgi:hypothetical protein